MNDIVAALGLESWKPVVSALLLPPLPLLLLILVGARLMFSRRMLAWLLIATAVALAWFTSTSAAGKLLRPVMMTLPEPLDTEAVAALKAAAKDGRTALVVLGAGRTTLAPEYGMSTLRPLSIERLRYGIWLSRETGLPLAYSGGVGHGAGPGPTEAEIAARIAEREFGRPLRWTEDRSRDTAQSGLLTVPMLQSAGIERIVIVTTDLHQPRALRAFARAAQREGKPVALLAAPMGVPTPFAWSWGDFVPSSRGFADTRILVHEWLGYWLGA